MAVDVADCVAMCPGKATCAVPAKLHDGSACELMVCEHDLANINDTFGTGDPPQKAKPPTLPAECAVYGCPAPWAWKAYVQLRDELNGETTQRAVQVNLCEVHAKGVHRLVVTGPHVVGEPHWRRRQSS